MPKAFIQGLSQLLSAAVVLQLAFANLAVAQINPSLSGNDSDPFWSNKKTAGGQVNPNDPNFWFNNNNNNGNGSGLSQDNGNGNGNSDDPWGNWDNPGDNNNPFNSGDWGNSGSDPFGVYGGWNSNVTKMTDSFYVKIMRAAGVTNKDYMATIHTYRNEYSAYGTEDDDAIADIIIKKHANYAGDLGAGFAVIPVALSYLWPAWTSQQVSFGYGVGMNLGGLFGDYVSIIAQEAFMMFELQALYGELSNDDEERTASTIIPFVLGMGGASINKLVSHKLRLDTLNPTPKPGPNPNPNPDPFGPSSAKKLFQPLTSTAPAENIPAVDTPGVVDTVSKPILTNPLTKETAQFVTWATMKGDLVNWIIKKWPLTAKVVHGKTVAFKFVESMPPVFRVIAAATAAGLVAHWTNYEICYHFGQFAKRYYKAMHQEELANVIHQLRSNSEAKAALWLILLKNVFQTPPNEGQSMSLADSKMYAAIISREMPLIKTDKWDELASLQNDYRNHPDMLDEYLTDLRNDLPVDSKLYLAKLLLGGVLMKGGMNRQDIELMKNFAISIGLYPPPKVNISSFKPDDERLIDRDRYLELKNQMQMATKEENTGTPQGSLPKDKNYVTANHWRSGQIVLQDFEDSDVKPMVDFFDQVKKNGGLAPSDTANANSLGNKVAADSGKPVTNVSQNGNNQPDPFQDPSDQSGQGQQAPKTTQPQSASGSGAGK